MCKYVLILLVFVCAVRPIATVFAEVNQQAIADVAAGKIKVAKASWWGFDSVDSTEALQAAINSGVPTLIVDKAAGPWIVTPIELTSNQEIRFEKGVEVLAKRGEFKGTGDSLFTARLRENITLIGYGATLRMWRSDYDAAPYAKAEWRHVLNFFSCSNVKVLGLTLSESGGDGIYLGTGKAGVTNKNVLIKDVVCDKNYRQGISVITAEDLLIENTVMKNTDGTAPRAGIDFEPNLPDERIVNCVMRDCVSENNAGAGYVAYLSPLNATSAPVSLRLENCRAIGNGGLACGIITGNTPAQALRGRVDFIHCTFQGGKGAGLQIGGNPATAIQILVQNCSILDVAQDSPATNPILFSASQDATQDLGGVHFVDCLVRDPLGRKPMGFVDDSGSLRLAGVTGNLILETKGTKTPVTITPRLLGEWVPAITLKRYPRAKLGGASLKPLTASAPADKFSFGDLRMRVKAHLVLYAKEGESVHLRFHHGQVGNYSGRPSPLTVADWSGKPIAKGSIEFQQEGDLRFQAPATGAYRVEIAPDGNYVRVVKSSHALSLSAETEPIHLIGAGGQFYFYVPAGTKEFGIKLFGEGLGEGVKATLYNAAGEQVGQKDDVTQAQQFEITLPEASRGEIWSLKTERSSHIYLEDYCIDLLGIPPLVAPSPEAVLAPDN
ncbi:MAG: right-handed parallel beta-helix repeat-containing protein [Planctomycetia bacterium]|nr:right-handed parallel beta-helix repeat-containing protein [Planctomycetia bacterium]